MFCPQIPYMKVTEGTLGLIDFSPRPQVEVSELNGGRPGSVSMLHPKPDHVIIDMEPEECPHTDLKDTGISCIPEYESPPYRPVPRDKQTEDQKQIAHLQDFNSNIKQWLEECDTQDEVESSCSEEGACSSLEWDKRCLEQIRRRSEHLTMLEQLHCEPPQESLSSESLNSDLSVCNNEYHLTNKDQHGCTPQPDSQQNGDVPNDRMFTGNRKIATINKRCNRLRQDIIALIMTNNQGSYIHLHLTMFTFHQVYNMSTTMSTNINMASTIFTDWKSTRVNNRPYKVRLIYIVVQPTNIQTSTRFNKECKCNRKYNAYNNG
ncbi:unnamed protein product [Mytilus edulis]|uniref:Uncharacterized protein n=1 Tax=Mytilus edulis TaxID=6550 RepID=A0A8S3T4C5_MYTED|nr:unnamed protein product [Mytilus edulis]